VEEKELQSINAMRSGGHVQRCHYFPHHGGYSVAEHSFQMALLLDCLHPNPTPAMFSYVLRHDLAEKWIGDIPGSIKRDVPGLREYLKGVESKIEDERGIAIPGLQPEEEWWIKVLDNVEFMMWCDEQSLLGNQYATPKGKEVLQWLRKNWDRVPPEVRAFLDAYLG
jgi:5'-deoxynucleotidase YfbR-like protein